MHRNESVQQKVKYNAQTITYAPEIVTLVSSRTPMLRGFNTQPYTGRNSPTKQSLKLYHRHFPTKTHTNNIYT